MSWSPGDVRPRTSPPAVPGLAAASRPALAPDVRPPKLLASVRQAIRLRHYSRRTETVYVGWVARFVRFHGLRHPRELGAGEVEAFLSDLAVRGQVSAATQSQARAALVFLYREVLGAPMDAIGEVVRAKRPVRLPVVLTRAEVRAVLSRLEGQPRLVALLLYGAGLRLLEALSLRVKDVDFGAGQLLVRHGKGGKDRVTMLPQSAAIPLAHHLEAVRHVHARDLTRGGGRVVLPDALERKYPAAGREWAGSGCSRHPAAIWTPPPGSGGATTCTNRPCSVPCAPPCCGLVSPSRRVATRSGTASRPICWRTTTISAPCRNCSGTATYGRR